MADIRLQRHDLLAQLLVEENLARGDDVAGYDGAVATHAPGGVGLDVDTRERIELVAVEEGGDRGVTYWIVRST